MCWCLDVLLCWWLVLMTVVIWWCVDVMMCWRLMCCCVDVVMCWCGDVLMIMLMTVMMCWWHCAVVLICWRVDNYVDMLMCCIDVLCWCVDMWSGKKMWICKKKMWILGAPNPYIFFLSFQIHILFSVSVGSEIFLTVEDCTSCFFALPNPQFFFCSFFFLKFFESLFFCFCFFLLLVPPLFCASFWVFLLVPQTQIQIRFIRKIWGISKFIPDPTTLTPYRLWLGAHRIIWNLSSGGGMTLTDYGLELIG